MSSKKGHGDWNQGHALMDNLSAKEGSSKLGGSVGLALAAHTHSLAWLHNERFRGNSWIDPLATKEITSGSRESAAISTPETVLTVVFWERNGKDW